MEVMNNPRKSVLHRLIEKHFEFPKRQRHTRSLLDLAKINARAAKRSVVPINIEKWLDFRLEKGQIRGINSGLTCIMGVGLGIFRQQEEARLTIVNVLRIHRISRNIILEIMNIPPAGTSIKKEDAR
jgi:hypothetical protein